MTETSATGKIPSAPDIDEGSRWSIWIDIEGFGRLWSEGTIVVQALRALMDGIHRLGTRVYPEDGERLFAHQFGDGFVIVADFHEAELDRCASIAVALMRYVARSGCLARAAIAEGEFADISGLWPRSIREAQIQNGGDDTVSLGSGLMTLLPVMGTALINANKLDARNPVKGAILTIGTNNARRVAPTFPRRVVEECPEMSVIDWVHATSTELDRIEAKSRLGWSSPEELEAAILAYIKRTSPPATWVDGTLSFNGLVHGLEGV